GRCPQPGRTGSTSTRSTAGRLSPAMAARSSRLTLKRGGKWRVWPSRGSPTRFGTIPIDRTCTSPLDNRGSSTSSTPARWRSRKRFRPRRARTPPRLTAPDGASTCSSRRAAGRPCTRRFKHAMLVRGRRILGHRVALGAFAALSLAVFCSTVRASQAPLSTLRDVPLPGPASRFDYASLDEARGRLYIAHLRSEEHTSELQSRENLVCRLLLEKKKFRLDV